MVENKFILDTHIWLSIFHSNRTERLIDALIEMDISCDEQCKEILDVISRPELKHLVTKSSEEYISFIDSISEIYESRKRFSLLTDYKDNYLVDLAWQSKSILVSDDKHFALMKKLKSPHVRLYSKTRLYKLLGW